MKNVRMLLTGALVTAIVSGSLAFTKINPDLFTCNAQNKCVAAPASSFDPGGAQQLNPALYYTTSAAANFICPKPNDPTIGCQTHPAKAFVNN